MARLKTLHQQEWIRPAITAISADVVAELQQRQRQPNSVVATILAAIVAGITTAAAADAATCPSEDPVSCYCCETVATVVFTAITTIVVAKVDNAPFTIGTAVAHATVEQLRQPAIGLNWLWLSHKTAVVGSVITAIADFGPELGQRAH